MKCYNFRILILLISSIFLLKSGKAQKLSDQSVISIVICAPAEHNLITSFGHCALRVYDPVFGLNNVYHYGVLESNHKGFLTDFFRGHLESQFEVTNYSLFKLRYSYFSRSTLEAPLCLTSDQKEKIFYYLKQNEVAENRRYKYDYVSTNCATKLRDVIIKSLENELLLDSFNKSSYRDLLMPYISERPWIKLLSDLAFGPMADKELTSTERMFLPYSLIKELESAWIIQERSNLKLIQKSHFFNIEESLNDYKPLAPLLFFSVFGSALIMLSVRDFRRVKISLWVDQFLFLITGFIGALFIVLWLGFNHKLMAWNLNLLWLLPTNLIIIFLPVHSTLRTIFCLASLVLTMGLLISWPFLQQILNPVFIPLIIGQLSRYSIYCVITMNQPNSVSNSVF